MRLPQSHLPFRPAAFRSDSSHVASGMAVSEYSKAMSVTIEENYKYREFCQSDHANYAAKQSTLDLTKSAKA